MKKIFVEMLKDEKKIKIKNEETEIIIDYNSKELKASELILLFDNHRIGNKYEIIDNISEIEDKNDKFYLQDVVQLVKVISNKIEEIKE